MKEFEASRLSDGNKIMPNKITIDDFGVTLRVPGVFSGKEKTLTYHQISSVQIDSPMVGYSTITFDTIGWDRIIAKGFSKEDAHEVKKLVQLGIQSTRSSGGGKEHGGGGSNLAEVLAASEAAKAQAEVEKMKIELEQEKIRNEEEAKEAESRSIKANKLREQNKPFLAWFTELNPTYSLSIIIFSIAICFTPIYIVGVTIILILGVFAAKDLIQFSKKILLIALAFVIVLPVSTALIIRSVKKSRNLEIYEKLTHKNVKENKKIKKEVDKELTTVEEESQNVEEINSTEVLIENEQSEGNSKVVYYKINDPDGYSNLRKEPKGDIIKKVYDTEQFEVLGEENDHKKIKLKDGTIGYIHKSRVIKN